jgi:hypothetical protein
MRGPSSVAGSSVTSSKSLSIEPVSQLKVRDARAATHGCGSGGTSSACCMNRHAARSCFSLSSAFRFCCNASGQLLRLCTRVSAYRCFRLVCPLRLGDLASASQLSDRLQNGTLTGTFGRRQAFVAQPVMI